MSFIITEKIGPQARDIMERDERLTSTSYTREYPLVVAKAEGSEIWDVDGNRYVDFMAGIAVHNVGHRHPRVVEAVKAQIDKFWHVCLSDFYYPEAVELSEKLAATRPFDEAPRFYYGNSGTEAIEAAAKLAMYTTGRQKFIAFMGSFHGRTMGALSFTASKRTQSANYPHALNVFHVPYPDPYRPLLNTYDGMTYGESVVHYIEEELFRVKVNPHDIAGVLVEPIQGEGGYVIPSPGFLPALRAMCDRYGILLMLDEIQSGVGRSGHWWAVQHEGVQPDILAFAKAIGSGLPLGGIMARESVMTWKPGAHGSTFGGNPVSMAAAIATLDVIREENLIARANESGEHILSWLVELKERHPHIGDVRGRGLMIGVEFVQSRQTKRRAKALRDEVVQRAFDLGLLILPCGENSVRLIPPLNIPHALIEEGLHLFEQAVKQAEHSHRHHS